MEALLNTTEPPRRGRPRKARRNCEDCLKTPGAERRPATHRERFCHSHYTARLRAAKRRGHVCAAREFYPGEHCDRHEIIQRRDGRTSIHPVTGENVWLCRRHEHLELTDPCALPGSWALAVAILRDRLDLKPDPHDGRTFCWITRGTRHIDRDLRTGTPHRPPRPRVKDDKGKDKRNLWLAYRWMYALVAEGLSQELDHEAAHTCNRANCIAPHHIEILPSIVNKKQSKTVTRPANAAVLGLARLHDLARDAGIDIYAEEY